MFNKKQSGWDKFKEGAKNAATAFGEAVGEVIIAMETPTVIMKVEVKGREISLCCQELREKFWVEEKIMTLAGEERVNRDLIDTDKKEKAVKIFLKQIADIA